MILTYQYRLKPTTDLEAIMLNWLELLRRHWNWSLGQRFDYLRRTRSVLDRCSLVSEPIGKIPDHFPNYNTQAGQLKQTKALFPEHKNIYHDVQQQNLKRLAQAWDRWIKPDKTGKRGGRPKFKKALELRSFTFPRTNCQKAGAFFENGVLRLSKIGSIRVIVHRPIPDGFTLKTCTIVRHADGWYCSISIEDESVPVAGPLDKVKTVVGVDVGLKEFLTTSKGEAVPIQQVYRKTQKHLARQQRRLEKKHKGSNRHKKQQNVRVRIHQHLGRQRQDFHYKVAHKLVKAYDLIAVEDLNIKGLAKSQLAK
jgi:putative transposase